MLPLGEGLVRKWPKLAHDPGALPCASGWVPGPWGQAGGQVLGSWGQTAALSEPQTKERKCVIECAEHRAGPRLAVAIIIPEQRPHRRNSGMRESHRGVNSHHVV